MVRQSPSPGRGGHRADPWVTIVWDDPVNLMSYVTHVFISYFSYPKLKAEKLMLQVHHEGKAIVSSGSREAMERDVRRCTSTGSGPPWTRRRVRPTRLKKFHRRRG